MSAGATKAKCPICGTAEQAEFRPFCSRGCKDRDLLKWLDGGYRIRGRWSFSSGCAHCPWVLLGGIAVRDGVPDHVTFLVPDSDYEIDDVWHVAGLAGTGSNDIVIEDAFVPARRIQPTASLIGGAGGTWLAGLIPALAPMLTGGGGAYVGQAVTGVVGGGILTAIVGLIKNMASPKGA